MLPAARRRLAPFVILSLAVLATACLPAKTATGRPGPVRKVALLGDSLTFGLFGTTPGVADPLRQRLSASGISVTIDGGPGDTLQTPWPGHANWAELLQARVDQDDPDVVIIQSILFPGAEDPANHDSYLRAAQKLVDIGQSRTFVDAVPGTTLEVVEGAGQLLFFSHWEAVLDALRRTAAPSAQAA